MVYAYTVWVNFGQGSLELKTILGINITRPFVELFNFHIGTFYMPDPKILKSTSIFWTLKGTLPSYMRDMLVVNSDAD